jgi:hypothetical protein
MTVWHSGQVSLQMHEPVSSSWVTEKRCLFGQSTRAMLEVDCFSVFICARYHKANKKGSLGLSTRAGERRVGTGSGDRREVSPTLKISKRYEQNDPCQTNTRKPSVCPQFPPKFPGKEASQHQPHRSSRKSSEMGRRCKPRRDPDKVGTGGPPKGVFSELRQGHPPFSSRAYAGRQSPV